MLAHLWLISLSNFTFRFYFIYPHQKEHKKNCLVIDLLLYNLKLFFQDLLPYITEEP